MSERVAGTDHETRFRSEPDRYEQDIKSAPILIVDDNPLSRSFVVKYLQREGFTNLFEASDGSEGLQLAAICRPELIISDLMMPNIDGFEFCRRLRADRALAHIPILVETGIDDPDQRATVFEAGASDLVAKPLNSREFLGRVRVHLERERLIQRLSDFQRQMREELEQARVIQEMLLPTKQVITQIEARYPLRVASHYEASIGIGGDFWGIEPISADRCRVFCADFAGHGVSAALNTFRLQSFIDRELCLIDDPQSWLSRANRFLCEVLPVGQYATMFCGVIDFGLERLTYAAASAPPPLILNDAHDPTFRPMDGSGLPLGIVADASYHNLTVPFAAGSILFLYSDALTEIPDLVNPAFNTQSLCEFLGRYRRRRDPCGLLQAVVSTLRGATPWLWTDDLTAILLEHLGPADTKSAAGHQGRPPSAAESRPPVATDIRARPSIIGSLTRGQFEIRTLEEAERLARMLGAFCPDPEKASDGIWELLSNAVEHGNLEIGFDEKRRLLEAGGFVEEVNRRLGLPQYASRCVRVEFEQTEMTIELTVSDDGKGFDFAAFMNADQSGARPNGRGIYITSQTCFDRLCYVGPGNQVRGSISRKPTPRAGDAGQDCERRHGAPTAGRPPDAPH